MRHDLDIIADYLSRAKIPEARHALRELFNRRIPRELYYEVAQLSRQANLPHHALRLLTPVVRPVSRRLLIANDREKGIYAGCLVRVGAEVEALKLLRSVDLKQFPEARLFMAFAHFVRWEYGAAIPILKAYITDSDLNPKERIVGKLNLVAALVHERHHEEAEPLLRELREATRAMRLLRFHANVLEISAQNAIFQQDWNTGLSYLEEAAQMLESGTSLDFLFVKKWRAVVSLRHHPNRESLNSLLKVQQEAKELGHWETVRDCDRWLSICSRDLSLFTHLYFGTPLPGFRARLLAEWGEPLSQPTSYCWNLRDGKYSDEVNLLRGEINGKSLLKLGQSIHRLLEAMTSDFYRPFRIVTLHHLLYPSENYNPSTSPMKVHNVIVRFREWTKQAKVGLSLEKKNNSYRLVATRPLMIWKHLPESSIEEDDATLKLLKQEYKDAPFSSDEASRVLRLSPRSARRILNQGIYEGTLQRQGEFKGARYRFAK